MLSHICHSIERRLKLSIHTLFAGLVDWKEYYYHFLLAKGYPVDKAQKHIEDYDIDLEYEGRVQKCNFQKSETTRPELSYLVYSII